MIDTPDLLFYHQDLLKAIDRLIDRKLDEREAAKPRIMTWLIDAPATGAAPFIHRLDFDSVLIGAYLYCDTAPSGGAFDVDIERSTTGGATWASICTERPIVASGSKEGGFDVEFTIREVSQGDLFRLNVQTVSGAANVMVQLQIQTRVQLRGR